MVLWEDRRRFPLKSRILKMLKISTVIPPLWVVLTAFSLLIPDPVTSIPLSEESQPTSEGHNNATTYVANFSARHGFPMEQHEAVTSDGYKLTMYFMRQKERKEKKRNGEGKVVFLSHGLLTSSDCWFLNDVDQLLPFRLYQEGYDVMLGNFRGTTHSPDHNSLDNNSTAYWDFSWDKLGLEDVSTMIDYTLTMTKQEKLYLVGHSMGTTTAFVLLSEKPEYNKKIHKLIALAPAVFLFHANTPIREYLTPMLKIWGAETIFRSYGSFNGKFPREYQLFNSHREQCGGEVRKQMEFTKRNESFNVSLETEVCKKVAEFLFDWDENDMEAFQTLISIPVETTSASNILHYAQSMNVEGFKRYDYGTVSNMWNYYSSSPPDYKLDKITCPVSIYWSPKDPFTAPEDIKMLQEKLTGTDVKVHKLEDWAHQDYIFSKNLKDELIPRILESLTSSTV